MAAVARAPRGAFVLIGFMGAGKTTVAAELAQELGVAPLDSDALLEAHLGHSLAEEFEKGSGFRAKEEQLVCELLAAAAPGAVISLGGGSVLSERVRHALREHVVVLLDVSAEEAWERVHCEEGGAERPLARDREAFLALYAERRQLYEQLADAQLPPLAPGAAHRTLDALRVLSTAPPGTRLLWAASASGDYPVLLGRRLLSAEGVERLARAAGLEGSRAFCVSDETVAPLYAQRLGTLIGQAALASGERHKTLSSAEAVWRALLDAGLTRSDHLIALGGGVVGDLAGFCAATYQRGVPIVHVPTTLVAQVDSAYGGKTGVDLPQAKNYIGAYHQPAGVLVDPDTLRSLPQRELAAGWVEVLKTALIAGGELWERVSRGEDADEEMIVACVRVKLAVVAADERDSGRRQVLNLGHTVGHAIEAATGYDRYLHGEAVGLGLLAALRVSGSDELRARARELLAARGLPVRLEGVSVDAVLEAIAHDKKRLRSGLGFVLVSAPGNVSFGSQVGPEQLHAAVAELAR